MQRTKVPDIDGGASDATRCSKRRTATGLCLHGERRRLGLPLPAVSASTRIIAAASAVHTARCLPRSQDNVPSIHACANGGDWHIRRTT